MQAPSNQYSLTETASEDGVLYTARHAGGQPVDWSRQHDEMQARVDQLNAGQPISEWAKVWRPQEYADMLTARAAPQSECPTCGLDGRTCDCG